MIYTIALPLCIVAVIVGERLIRVAFGRGGT